MRFLVQASYHRSSAAGNATEIIRVILTCVCVAVNVVSSPEFFAVNALEGLISLRLALIRGGDELIVEFGFLLFAFFLVCSTQRRDQMVLLMAHQICADPAAADNRALLGLVLRAYF